MTGLAHVAPGPLDAPLDEGAFVCLDAEASFLDDGLLAGGSPWRLLRLSGPAGDIVKRWSSGASLRAGEGRFARTLVSQGFVHPLFRSGVDLDQVDVIIPVLDDIASLRVLLAQLRPLHVTVVDDGSRNPTLVAECAARFNAALVRLPVNLGPGGARNAGAAATQRPLLWFMDADVVLDNALDVIARLGAQFADPLLGAIAPRIRGGAGPTVRDHFEQGFSPLDMGVRSGLARPGSTIAYVPSACLVVRRSAFGEGFDERLRVGEDVDLIWRLHDRGWLIRYAADTVVTHRARGTWRDWFHQRISYGASSSPLAQRHGKRLAPVRVDLWTLVTWTSLVTRAPAIGLRVTGALHRSLRSRLPESPHAGQVATRILLKGTVRSIGPFLRALVRTFGPLLLVAAVHPRLRTRALAAYILGTAWRWRRATPRFGDVALGVADDLTYSVGVGRGAWRARSLQALTPEIVKSSLSVREVLGLDARVKS